MTTEKYCPQCGALHKDGDRFCRVCGKTIEATEAAPRVSPEEEIQPTLESARTNAGGVQTEEKGRVTKKRTLTWVFAAIIGIAALGGICSAIYSANKPALAQKHLDKGKTCAESENYSEAINEFSKAIKLNPSYDAYYERGIAYSNSNNSFTAMEDFAKAIGLAENDGDKWKAYTTRTIIYLRKGNWDEAIADCTKAINFAPTQVARGSTYSFRALAYARRDGNNDETQLDSDLRNARREGVDPIETLRKFGLVSGQAMRQNKPAPSPPGGAPNIFGGSVSVAR